MTIKNRGKGAGVGASFAPQGLLKKLPPLYSTDGTTRLADKPLLAKWFSPYSNWTWYAAECDSDPTSETYGRCFGYVEGFEGEWGNFDLTELASLHGMGGMLPLVERDAHFTTATYGELFGTEA